MMNQNQAFPDERLDPPEEKPSGIKMCPMEGAINE